MAGDSKRSPRRGAALFVQKFLRWLNYIVLAASLVSIVCMIALRLFPTAWGWGFLTFSFLSILSAVVGCISASQSACCYGFHMFLLITSTCIQGAVFLLLVTKPDSVLERLQSNRSQYDGRILVKVDAALLLGTFCIQLIVLALGCMLHYCEPTDYYEDLDGKKVGRRGRNLAKVQEETIADAEAGQACAVKEESEMSRLHKAMKDKYSQKTSKEEVFDPVEL